MFYSDVIQPYQPSIVQIDRKSADSDLCLIGAALTPGLIRDIPESFRGFETVTISDLEITCYQ